MSDAGRSGVSLDVVVVEPWYGGSHRAWADGMVRHSDHAVRLVTHPDRFWRWRLRGGAVTLAAALRSDIEARRSIIAALRHLGHADSDGEMADILLEHDDGHAEQ